MGRAHPTTLMKLTTRCGATAVEGLNEALLANAVDGQGAAHDPVAGGHHGGARQRGVPDRLGAVGLLGSVPALGGGRGIRTHVAGVYLT